MHVAICIWGLLRSINFTIKSFEEHILLPLAQFNATYDIFVHTYNISGKYANPRNHEKETALNVSNWRLLRPKYVFIEGQEEFDRRIDYIQFQSKGDPWRNNFSSFQNHMRALNSLYHITSVVESLREHVRYDTIVMVRPDVRFIVDLPIQLMLQPSSRHLYLPDFHRSCHSGEYNDRMVMGDVEAGIIYGKKFESAYAYSLAKPLHAEKITFHQLTTNNIQVTEIPFRFQRIRASGELHIRDREAVTPERQAELEAKGNYFVGRGKRTPWYMCALYTLLEVLTLNTVYIWNHDDHGNVFCHPHNHLSHTKLKALKQQALARPPPVTIPSSGSNSYKRIVCEYELKSYDFTTNNKSIPSRYIRPYNCHPTSTETLNDHLTQYSFHIRTGIHRGHRHHSNNNGSNVQRHQHLQK